MYFLPGAGVEAKTLDDISVKAQSEFTRKYEDYGSVVRGKCTGTAFLMIRVNCKNRLFMQFFVFRIYKVLSLVCKML